MLDTFLSGWQAWWDTVTPEFAFLLALPFGVAGLGLMAHAIRHRRGRR